MKSKLPLVVILGATGAGKTKLSLELALKYGGEIIGADSMQVYKGLDIITAKATKEEQNVVPHHLISVLSPHETMTVLDYRNRALKIIDDLYTKKKMPIVVGGTNYYIESLLWKILIENPESANFQSRSLSDYDEHTLPSCELHKKLQLLDPEMAKRLHPNNKRKILRALEVLGLKGRKLSDILSEQQKSEGGNTSGGGLRFTNALVLWVQCEQEILDKRLDSRVDSMIEQGLLKELTEFHHQYNLQRIDDSNPDYTKGIFQSIGLKEFHKYLMLPAEHQADTEDSKRILQEGIEQLKIATRRYARRQKKWIINRFLGRSDRQAPPVYALDSTNVEGWLKNVSEPATEIIDSFLNGTPCAIKPLPSVARESLPNSMDDSFFCEVCQRVFIGQYQWNIHRKSTKHKKMVESTCKKRDSTVKKERNKKCDVSIQHFIVKLI